MATRDATVQPYVSTRPKKRRALLEQEIATDTVFVVQSEGVTGTGYHFMPYAWLGGGRRRTSVVFSYPVFSSRSSDRRPRPTDRSIRPVKSMVCI